MLDWEGSFFLANLKSPTWVNLINTRNNGNRSHLLKFCPRHPRSVAPYSRMESSCTASFQILAKKVLNNWLSGPFLILTLEVIKFRTYWDWILCSLYSNKDKEPNFPFQTYNVICCLNRLFEQEEDLLNSYNIEGQQEQTQVKLQEWLSPKKILKISNFILQNNEHQTELIIEKAFVHKTVSSWLLNEVWTVV